MRARANVISRPFRKRLISPPRLRKFTGRNKKPNRTGRTDPNRPNRLIPEPAGTGRGNEPNRTWPSHDASEKRRQNRVESEKMFLRTEPNRTESINCRQVRNRNESNRTGSFLCQCKYGYTYIYIYIYMYIYICIYIYIYIHTHTHTHTHRIVSMISMIAIAAPTTPLLPLSLSLSSRSLIHVFSFRKISVRGIHTNAHLTGENIETMAEKGYNVTLSFRSVLLVEKLGALARRLTEWATGPLRKGFVGFGILTSISRDDDCCDA